MLLNSLLSLKLKLSRCQKLINLQCSWLQAAACRGVVWQRSRAIMLHLCRTGESTIYFEEKPFSHSLCAVFISFDAAVMKIQASNRSTPPDTLPHFPHRRVLVQSTSLHSLDDLQGGKARYGALDYAFLSPIFDSISKKASCWLSCWEQTTDNATN